jgi:Predicted Zn-dependent peptidases
VFYASVRDQYVERAIDILSDITFHSVFPQAQIDKERGVILEEMAMYLDTPDDSLQDEFDALLFENHPMGMNILGRQETVSSFMRKDFCFLFQKSCRYKPRGFQLCG